MYEIPIEQQIQRQLIYEQGFESALIDWADLPRTRDGSLSNVQDGTISQEHPMLSQPKKPGMIRLGLGAYVDDVEICNPLGYARTKHKVTLHYATILNVPAHARSQLDQIYLVAVVLAKDQQDVGARMVVQGDEQERASGVNACMHDCSFAGTACSYLLISLCAQQ